MIRKKELGKISFPRNPILFDTFHRINLIEKAGSGINRIKKLARERNLKVRFEANNFFKVKFERKGITPQVTPQVELTELEKKIIAEIRDNHRISRNELAKKLEIRADTIKEYLDKLKDKGILRRVGRTSAGYWDVKK